MTRDQLPTPSLVLDHDAMTRNIATMTAFCRDRGVGLRAHAKCHKSVAIARLLADAGAIGASCATIGEAEAMAAGGITGILVTSPMATPDQLRRVRRLVGQGADLTLVVDDPDNVDALDGLPLPLVVDLDGGSRRTGCASVDDAAALAERIARNGTLRLAGVQCYWGHLQQVMPFEERRRRVDERKAGLHQLLDRIGPVEIVTGAGTGSFALDTDAGPFTEIQAGSFLFLDSQYSAVPVTPDGNPFEPSLFVRTAVVSRGHPGRVIVDAGLKALATDSGAPIPERGAPPDATYRFMGDEHGAIDFDPALPSPPLGAAIELLTPHCDPTVNLHDRYHVVRGDEVIDAWLIVRGYGTA